MVKSWAQAGQDEWVHGMIGESGYFVDVGAHDGIVHSNTYALEQRGWTGICIEPDTVWSALMLNRSCVVSGVAISNRSGGVTIQPAGVLRGCETLTQCLHRFDAPSTIDYLSIDVEGHELQVLAGMDFDRWHVHLLTVEHNLYCDGPDRKNAIHEVLTGHGFERVREDVVAEGYGAYEDWYQKKGDTR